MKNFSLSCSIICMLWICVVLFGINLKTLLAACFVLVNSGFVSLSYINFSYFFSVSLFLVMVGAFLVVTMYIMTLTVKEKGVLFLLPTLLVISGLSYLWAIFFGSSAMHNTGGELDKEFFLDQNSISVVSLLSIFLFICLFIVTQLDVSRFSSLRKKW